MSNCNSSIPKFYQFRAPVSGERSRGGHLSGHRVLGRGNAAVGGSTSACRGRMKTSPADRTSDVVSSSCYMPTIFASARLEKRPAVSKPEAERSPTHSIHRMHAAADPGHTAFTSDPRASSRHVAPQPPPIDTPTRLTSMRACRPCRRVGGPSRRPHRHGTRTHQASSVSCPSTRTAPSTG
jgi:hypothetical protein